MAFLICNAFHCFPFNHRQEAASKGANGKIRACRVVTFISSEELEREVCYLMYMLGRTGRERVNDGSTINLMKPVTVSTKQRTRVKQLTKGLFSEVL